MVYIEINSNWGNRSNKILESMHEFVNYLWEFEKNEDGKFANKMFLAKK